jgi:hypothetical protein
LLGEGVSRDISVAGAFIFTRTCPPIGATLELEIFLSPAGGGSAKRVQIKTEARVIRVEHTASAEGFAAVSQDFTLLFDTRGRNRFLISSTDHTEGEEREGGGSGAKSSSRSFERLC